jgi:hypothetical protein
MGRAQPGERPAACPGVRCRVSGWLRPGAGCWGARRRHTCPGGQCQGHARRVSRKAGLCRALSLGLISLTNNSKFNLNLNIGEQITPLPKYFVLGPPAQFLVAGISLWFALSLSENFHFDITLWPIPKPARPITLIIQ